MKHGLVVELVRRLVSHDPRERDRAADEVTDVLQGLGHLGPCVAHVLALSRLAETDVRAQEAQLHALVELDGWDLLPDAVRALLAAIDRSTVVGSQIEYAAQLIPDW